MADIRRPVLFGKLNSAGYKTLEAAAVFCKMRGNPCVEVVHWVKQILELPDSDWHRILRHFGSDVSRLAADLTRALDSLPRGASSISDLSASIDEAMERAWVYGTLLYEDGRVRTGYLAVGIMKTKSLRNELWNISNEFRKWKEEELSDTLAAILKGSPEAELGREDAAAVTAGAEPGEASGAVGPAQMGKGEALRRYSVDLTERARRGEMDPILGRDKEIRQIINILSRRRQNNPILTGEAGVGKTAVVEGFAQRVVKGDVPPTLAGVTVRCLDVGLLQAGASMKGEFEQRLRQVIEEVQASPTPVILFIDEAHTLIGAGGSAGTGDAANLLKPALARGTLRTIAATTWAEYKKYIEKDPALTRRFEVVKIEEPVEEQALIMVRGLVAVMEKHHQVLLLDEALEAAVRLSHRYIPARQLPDKAVSLLDTACARVRVSQHSTPAELEDCQRSIETLETELRIIGREETVGYGHTERKAEVEALLATERERETRLRGEWEKQRQLVTRILELRQRLRGEGAAVEAAVTPEVAAANAAPAAPLPEAAPGIPAATPAAAPAAPLPEAAPGTPAAAPAAADREGLMSTLRSLQEELAGIQGDHPLILPSVDGQAVAAIVADWTGIPVGRMVKNEIQAVLALADTLDKRVLGQRHALEAIARRVQTSRAGMDNPQRPIGVFLLAGPSGVGKTETALALAESLYGGEHNLITINMSEFQEAHTVSTLKGAPPGYVGYGEGGVLTEAVRRRPYSVVLLDEVEKAHRDVHEIFFQVFDKGWMEDGEGRFIDFKNTIILLTCNVGSEFIMNACADPDTRPEADVLAGDPAFRKVLQEHFPAALLGRLVTVPYFPISSAVLVQIIRLQLGRIKSRLASRRKVAFEYDEAVVDLVKSRCSALETGARMVDAILTHSVLPAISLRYLTMLMEGREVRGVRVGVKDGEFTYEFA